jgi:hypothetical protein
MLNEWKKNRIKTSFGKQLLQFTKELTGALLAVTLCMTIEYYRTAYVQQQAIVAAKQRIEILNFLKPEQFPIWKLWSIILVAVLFMFYKRVNIKLFVVFGLILNLMAMYSFRPTGVVINLEYILMTLIYAFIEVVVIYYIFQLFIQSTKKAEL